MVDCDWNFFLSIVLNNSSACNPIYLLSEICRSEYHPYICWIRLSEYRPYIWRATLIAAGLESVSACQVENFRPINACTTLKSNSLIFVKTTLVLDIVSLVCSGVLSFDPKWLWFQTSWKYFSPHIIKVGGRGGEKGYYLWVSRNVQTCFDGLDLHPFYMHKAIWEIF
jgi:hypothetical protein